MKKKFSLSGSPTSKPRRPLPEDIDDATNYTGVIGRVDKIPAGVRIVVVDDGRDVGSIEIHGEEAVNDFHQLFGEGDHAVGRPFKVEAETVLTLVARKIAVPPGKVDWYATK